MSIVTAAVTKVRTSPAPPNPVVPGGNVTYTITASYSIPTLPSVSSIVDTFPAGTTFVSATAPPGWTGPIVVGNTITFQNLSVVPVPAVFTITIFVPASLTGSITNTVVFNAIGAVNSPVTASVTDPLVPSADLSVVKIGPALSCGKEPISYLITVTNLGLSNASSVILSDLLSSGASVISFTQVNGPPFTITNNSFSPFSCQPCKPCKSSSSSSFGNCGSVFTTVTATIATFVSGAMATFQLIVCPGKSDCAGNLVNTASVSSVTADSNPSNNTSTVTTFIERSEKSRNCEKKKKCHKSSKNLITNY